MSFTKYRVPEISEEELNFLISREFPQDIPTVRSLLVGFEDHFIHENRIKAAIIKLSKGDLDELKNRIEQACRDPRDVVGYAEYPREMEHSGADLDNMARNQLNSLKLADWKEYEEWRNKEK